MHESKTFEFDGTAAELRRALAGIPDDARVRGKGHVWDFADAMHTNGPRLRSVTFEVPMPVDTPRDGG